MNIRTFTAQDEQMYLELAAEFYADSDAVDHPVPAHHAKRTFAALMERQPFVNAFLAEDDSGSPLGFTLLAITWSNEAGGLTIWIEELLVLSHARGQGVARALIEAVKNAYPQACRYRLEVTRENTRAISLYTSLGFQPLPYDQMILDYPPADQ